MWGWKERRDVGKMKIRYIKSVLSLDRYTLNYMVLDEKQRDRMRIKAGRRAMKLDEKVKEEERREKREVEKTEREGYSRRSRVSQFGVEQLRSEGQETNEKAKGKGELRLRERSKYNITR